MVGRDKELRWVVEAIEAGRGKRGGAVVVYGIAGIGKSRLLAEAMAAARERGRRTLHGAAQVEQGLSFALVVEALRPLVEADDRSSGLTNGLPDLGRLFPGLPVPPDVGLGDPDLDRTRLFEAVRQLLDRAARRQPLVLVLDDLHWADQASLALLHHLLRGLAGAPCLFLLGYRDTEVGPALADLLAVLRREQVTELALRPIGAEAVDELCRSLLAGAAPAELLAMLATRAGGVPLFVVEIVRHLVDSGALFRRRKRWELRPGASRDVPAVVEDLLRRRLDGLTDEARSIVELVALCGGAALDDVLGHLVDGDDALDAGLSSLQAAGLVEEAVVDGVLVHRVTHPLVAEVAQAGMSERARRRRHAAVARAYERALPGDLRSQARHVLGAGSQVPAEHALEVLVAAAGDALSACAGDEAVADLEGAVRTARTLGRESLLPELLEQQAQAQAFAGRTADARRRGSRPRSPTGPPPAPAPGDSAAPRWRSGTSAGSRRRTPTSTRPSRRSWGCRRDRSGRSSPPFRSGSPVAVPTWTRCDSTCTSSNALRLWTSTTG
jgi:predicted ATPase